MQRLPHRLSFDVAIGLALFALIGLSVQAESPVTASRVHTGDAATPAEAGPIQADPASVAAFWTEQNMKDAESANAGFPSIPREGPLWPGVADDYGYMPVAPVPNDAAYNNYIDYALPRINGMLFYKPAGGTKLLHCSASVLTSHSKSVILTAAHCVKDAGGWMENVMFVPAYNGSVTGAQATPFGKWPIRQAFIPEENAYMTDNDIAVLRLHLDLETATIGLEEVVRDGLLPRLSQPGETFALVDVYGYPGINVPGASSYIGKQWHCLSTSYAHNPFDPESTRLYTPQCSTMSGNSGGPFVLSHLDGRRSEVVSVVHDDFTSSRLTEANFNGIFQAADADEPPAP